MGNFLMDVVAASDEVAIFEKKISIDSNHSMWQAAGRIT